MPSIGPKRFLLDVDDDNEVSISIIHDTCNDSFTIGRNAMRVFLFRFRRA